MEDEQWQVDYDALRSYDHRILQDIVMRVEILKINNYLGEKQAAAVEHAMVLTALSVFERE
jgi:hypothetical protein